MKTKENQKKIRVRALTVYTQMMRSTNKVTEEMHQHLLERKITLSQFGVLEALFHLGPLCQKEIGEKILKTSGNMTMVIDNLEKQDLVIRMKDEEDRRKMTVVLTQKGYDLIEEIFPLHDRIAEDIFTILTDKELNTLSRLLKKIGKQAF